MDGWCVCVCVCVSINMIMVGRLWWQFISREATKKKEWGGERETNSNVKMVLFLVEEVMSVLLYSLNAGAKYGYISRER